MSAVGRFFESRGWHVVSALMLGVAGIFVFSPVFQAGFWTDDFVFVELAARRGLADYLSYYFDPRNIELLWYRPAQGIQWWIEYQIFGVNPMGYHIVNVIFHIANCWLLFNLVSHFTHSQFGGFISAFAFLSLPRVTWVVSWPGVADPLMTLFYLASLSFWIAYLEQGRRRAAGFAWLAFIGALLTKEMGTTLIAILFLADRLLVTRPASLTQLAKRYLPFVIILIPYALIEYEVSRRGVYVGQVAYGLRAQSLANLWQYAQWLAFPWDLGAPWNQIAQSIVAAAALYWLAVKRQRAVIFLVACGLIAVFPVLPFPFALDRYLYLPVIAPLALLGLGCHTARAYLTTPRWRAALASGALALFLLGNGATVYDVAGAYTGFVRETRLQFRPIFQRHPTFLTDTILYFIEPPFPTPTISAMMYVRYGAKVYAYGTDRGRVAGLRNHDAAFVYYRDDQNVWQELTVAKKSTAHASSSLPAQFEQGLELSAFEMVNDRVKRGDPFALIVYWHATQPIAKDYTVFAHVVDASGRIVAGFDSQPHQGSAPTSSWRADTMVADGTVIPIDTTVAPGAYAIEIGWYDLATSQRLALLDAGGQPIGDKLNIGPIYVDE
ncbi:MAG: hypothetical protein AB1817_01210 [Chloroflexota bacterium]